jgi:ABC-2 type transport system permease protein
VKRTLHQIADATRMQYRQTFRELGLLLAFVILFPLRFLFFLGVLARSALLVQVVVGSVMMETALLNVNVLAQTIGNDKETKLYDLWVSLPVSPVVYVVANALGLLPFSLLSAFLTLGVGDLYFHLGIALGLVPVLLLAFLLVWASTLGIGFLIGVYGRSPRQINSLAQFVGILMSFFAPIFYPVTLLPLPLQYLADAWPLTWGAGLLAALVHSDFGAAALASAVLAGFSLLWLVVIGYGLRWRAV